MDLDCPSEQILDGVQLDRNPLDCFHVVLAASIALDVAQEVLVVELIEALLVDSCSISEGGLMEYPPTSRTPLIRALWVHGSLVARIGARSVRMVPIIAFI
jgi:hypothetical protein